MTFKQMKGNKEAAPKKSKEKKTLRLCFGGVVNYSPIFAFCGGFET
jgi:hypothetical protein